MTIVNVIATETTAVTAAPEATKDAGRVKLGGGAVHFSDQVTGRAATKDAGRVKLGGGAIQF
jgi:hypothetical protein